MSAPDDLTDTVRAAAKLIVGAILNLIQVDPHQWSERPCATCRSVSAMAGYSFGCVLYAEKRNAARSPMAPKRLCPCCPHYVSEHDGSRCRMCACGKVGP